MITELQDYRESFTGLPLMIFSVPVWKSKHTLATASSIKGQVTWYEVQIFKLADTFPKQSSRSC